MRAPEGWLYAAVESRLGPGTRLDVLAVSPSGDIRSVATLTDATRAPGAGRDLRTASGRGGTTIATVTTDGYLPLALDWSDDAVADPMLLRVFDLLAPDPAATAVDLERMPDRLLSWDTVRSGADGRLSISV